MTDVRMHRPRVSTWWWTRKRSYLVFVLRELSSIFIAWFVVYLLLLVYAVGRGEAAYQRFLDWASSPWVTALNVVATHDGDAKSPGSSCRSLDFVFQQPAKP